METVKTFVNKFANDWTMNLASMLTYSLITAVVPLMVASLSLAGLVIGHLSPSTYMSVQNTVGTILPAQVQGSGGIKVSTVLRQVVKLTGPLAVLSLIGLTWAGSNLFTNVENAFSIIFRVRCREFIPQRLMAIGMVLLLTILLPLSLLAASLITAGSAAFGSILPSQVRASLTIAGPLASLAILWLLFFSMYIVVPNRRMRIREVWAGSTTAAVLFAVFNILFPLYFKIFLSGSSKYGAVLFSIIVLIAWLWVFAVITLVGAQVNAVGLKIAPFEKDIATTLAQLSERPDVSISGNEKKKLATA